MVIKRGCLDPPLLTGAFQKEVHGVTLVPLGALICVDVWVLPRQTHTPLPKRQNAALP